MEAIAAIFAQSVFAAVVLAGAQPAQTATGIPLDAPWKVTIYDLARSQFHHPAWGWQHSERNYRVALELAQGDGLRVDSDVLFAAAFLHDMAAFMPCKEAKLEHGECAARQSGAVLRSAGFPMDKLPAVEAAERGHMYYSNPGSQPEAIVPRYAATHRGWLSARIASRDPRANPFSVIHRPTDSAIPRSSA